MANAVKVLNQLTNKYEWRTCPDNELITDKAAIKQLENCESCKDFVALGNLWKFVEPAAGLGSKVEYWQPTALGGNAAPHANVDQIFTNTGTTWTHANGAASHTGTNTAYFGFSTASTVDLAYIGLPDRNQTNGTDQLKVSGYFYLPDPVSLIDVNGNTGERGLLSLQQCCTGSLAVVSQDNTDSAGSDRSAFPPVTISAGIHYAEMLTSDLSAWQGVDLRDADNKRIQSYLGKPKFDCIKIIKCKDNGKLLDAVTMQEIEIAPNDTWCQPQCQNKTTGVWNGCDEQITYDVWGGC